MLLLNRRMIALALLNDLSELFPLYVKMARIQTAYVAAFALQSCADVGAMFVCDVADHAVLESK